MDSTFHSLFLDKLYTRDWIRKVVCFNFIFSAFFESSEKQYNRYHGKQAINSIMALPVAQYLVYVAIS